MPSLDELTPFAEIPTEFADAGVRAMAILWADLDAGHITSELVATTCAIAAMQLAQAVQVTGVSAILTAAIENGNRELTEQIMIRIAFSGMTGGEHL